MQVLKHTSKGRKEVCVMILDLYSIIAAAADSRTLRGRCYLKRTGCCLEDSFGTRFAQEPSKGPLLRMKKCFTQLPMMTLPPTHLPAFLLLYLALSLPCPHHRPSALTAALLSGQGQWFTLKEKQGKKKRPVSQDCLFADGIFKSSTS